MQLGRGRRGGRRKSLHRKSVLKKMRMGSYTITQGATFLQVAAVARNIKVAVITKDYPMTNLGVEELGDLEGAIENEISGGSTSKLKFVGIP